MKRTQRIFSWMLGVAVALFALAIVLVEWTDRRSRVATGLDTVDARHVTWGREIYVAYCASCHGVDLEGQPNWQQRLPSGRLPAPPHDATGHTWHHPDRVLFGIVKEGPVPGKYAPPGHVSDMPAFGDVLADDEIRAVLGYIKSTWPERERSYQIEVDRRDRARD